MTFWIPSRTGGACLYRSEDDNGPPLADISEDVETGRWGVWSDGDYLGSSPDVEGAKQLAERRLGAEQPQEQTMARKEHDTSKLEEALLVEEAPPEKPKRTRKPRADKGKPRAKDKGNAGADLGKKLSRLAAIDAEIQSLTVERAALELTADEREFLESVL